jgi:serine/threonine-protein kinase
VSDSIPGYRLEKEVGRNAWGRSYRAIQLSLERPVLLTRLDPGFGSIALARACAALTHPHLVSGIDFGETGEGPFLVSEWVTGPTLGDVVFRGGPLAEERAIAIALATAQALDAASRKAIVHGAIDPEAIVIVSGGSPKIRGFGADRIYAQAPEDYRSPEQKRGEATDVRSDIYSLGATLYFALSARYPFQDAPPAEVVEGQVRELPFPLAKANRRLAPDLVALVDRMMAPLASERFESGVTLVRAVEELSRRREEQIRVRPTPPARPERTRRPRRRRRR